MVLTDLVDDLSELLLVDFIRLLLLLILLVLHQKVVHVDADRLVISWCLDICDAQSFSAIGSTQPLLSLLGHMHVIVALGVDRIR